jgi:hypothetical protein
MDKKVAIAVFSLLFGCYLFTMGGHSYSIDEELYLSSTKSFIEGSVTLDLSDTTVSRNLRLYETQGDRGISHTGLGVVVLYAPFAVMGELVSSVFSGFTSTEIYRLVFFSANSFYTAVIGTAIFLLSRQMSLSKRRAAALALIYGLCTYQWHYASNGFPQTLAALTIFLTYFNFLKWKRNQNTNFLRIAGVLFGFCIAVRTTNILFAPVFCIAVFCAVPESFSRKLRNVFEFVLSSTPIIFLTAWFNWAKFGNLLTSGYGKMNFDTPVYEGLYGLFFSSGKGLVFYAPITLIAMFGLRKSLMKFPMENYLALAIIMVQAVVYGKYEVWSGENSYGPRYLIPILPLIVILVVPLALLGKQWITGLVTSSIFGFLFAGLMGKLMYFNGVYWNQRFGLLQNMDASSLSVKQTYVAWNFQPRSSPLMLQLRSIPDLVSNTLSRLSGGLGKLDQIPISYDDRIHWYARTINLDFWWAWWPAKSSNQFVFLFLAVPIALIAFGGIQLMKELRVSESSNENEI